MAPFELGGEQLRKSVYTDRFAALARADVDLATWRTWDPGLVRDQRILVPVDVQARVVPTTGGEVIVRVGGIDGDPAYARGVPAMIEHDFSTGPLALGDYDLGWSVEFVEHVEECHLANVIAAFRACRTLFMTAAVPGQPGHHHVNCQWGDYWIARMADQGFVHEIAATTSARACSTMISRFSEQTGLVFRRNG